MDYGPRQELWTHTEEEALEIVRALLREGAAVEIAKIPEAASGTGWPAE